MLCSSPARRCRRPRRSGTRHLDLIVDPFFVRGGRTSRARLARAGQPAARRVGYGWPAVVGVALGTLVGQSVWAMRGLDPIFQVLRTVPPLAWLPMSLAAFRDASRRRSS
jgi:nitrate/nitrite transport system permease protein